MDAPKSTLRAGDTTLTIAERVQQLFEKHREPVLRYLIATFGDGEQAEEIVQEAFLRLYKAMTTGDQIAIPKAWVFRVAHNLAVNQIKRQQFLQPLSEDAWDRIETGLATQGDSPEQDLLKKEKYRRLRTAMSTLTVVERSCLNLRTKGFKYKEIGEILEMGTTSVAETLYRVIEKLGKQSNG